MEKQYANDQLTCRYVNSRHADLLVTMEQRSGEQREIIIEAYFKNKDLYTLAQRQFCNRYNIRRVTDASSKNVVKSWFNKFGAADSAQNKKQPDQQKSVRTTASIAGGNATPRRSEPVSMRRHCKSVALSFKSF